MIFKHTENMEMACYGIFGFLIAILPVWLKIWFPSDRSATKGTNEPSSFIRFVQKHYVFCGAGLALLALNYLYPFRDLTFQFWFLYVGILAVLFVGTYYGVRQKTESWKLSIGIFNIFAIWAFILNFSTSYANVGCHHWGAYLSAAKSMYSDSAIFTDFPAQYGFGPTLAIYTLSGFGWVTGMFYMVGSLEFLLWFACSLMAIVMIHRKFGANYLLYLVTLVILTGCCFYWGYDINRVVNAFPSLGGSRFFPAVLLATFLVVLDINAENLKSKTWFLHCLWAFGVFWSIESAFYVTLIWWPYYLFIHLSPGNNFKQLFLSVLKSVSVLLSVATIWIIVFILAYRFIYSFFPSLAVYKLFIDYIRGSILITFHGRFLFSVFMFFFGMLGLIFNYRQQSGYSREFRNLFVLLMLAYGPYSYYIGRSADYNILPLLPFFALILICVALSQLPKLMRISALALLLTSTAFMWIRPIAVPYAKDDVIRFDSSKINSDYLLGCEIANGDNGNAISFLVKNYPNEGIVNYDHANSIVLSGNAKDWNIYNNTTTYDGLPIEVQQALILKSKNKLMRQGWLICNQADKPDLQFAMNLFLPAYDIAEVLPFGTVSAYHLIPKRN